MPERLTEILVDQGALEPQQADEAIKRQVLQGGALDTSLLELELVEETKLLKGMAAAYGQAAATLEDVTAPLDEKALRAFPEQWAKKHMLAPLLLEPDKSALSILSPAPADNNLILRLGELLELQIHTKLVTEFRVYQRIALLYGQPPPERFKQLIDRHGGSLTEPLPPRQPQQQARPLTFGEAVTQLRDSHERDDIALTMLRYAIRDMEFAAMFVVHNDTLEGWMGLGPQRDQVPGLMVPLSSDSAFKVVLDTRAHYLGPLPSDPLHQHFLESLGRPHPHAVLIIPVRIKNRTIALLYGENGSNAIPPRLAADLMLFTTHVQSALEALLLRKKAESISELPAPVVEPNKLGPIQLNSPEPRPAAIETREAETKTYAYIKGKDTGDLYPVEEPVEEPAKAPIEAQSFNESFDRAMSDTPLSDLTEPNPAQSPELDQILIEEPIAELTEAPQTSEAPDSSVTLLDTPLSRPHQPQPPHLRSALCGDRLPGHRRYR